MVDAFPDVLVLCSLPLVVAVAGVVVAVDVIDLATVSHAGLEEFGHRELVMP